MTEKKSIPQMEPWFDKNEAKALYKYMQTGGWATEFKKTEEMESMICDFTGAKYCVMTNNGTVSLTLACLALNLKPQDEVLIPDLTMIASPNAVALIGMKPVLIDIEKDTLCMDLSEAEKKITKKTKALMYVSFNGRSGDMSEVVKFCHKHNLLLIEDSAQALGSLWKGKHLGTFGEIGSFSFSTPKIISTGQGGALITNKLPLYKKIKRLKDFGRDKGGMDIHNHWGWNFKFTDVQATIGIEQIKKLNWRIKRKKEIYKRYVDGLKHIKKIKLIPTDLTDTNPWFIDIYISNPNKLALYLKQKGIGTRKIYPPIHSQKIYQQPSQVKLFPVTKKYASEGLWLPSSTKLKNLEIDRVINTIVRYFEHK